MAKLIEQSLFKKNGKPNGRDWPVMFIFYLLCYAAVLKNMPIMLNNKNCALHFMYKQVTTYSRHFKKTVLLGLYL